MLVVMAVRKGARSARDAMFDTSKRLAIDPHGRGGVEVWWSGFDEAPLGLTLRLGGELCLFGQVTGLSHYMAKIRRPVFYQPMRLYRAINVHQDMG